MSFVGLFTSLAGTPPTVSGNTARTTGYSTVGIGPAWYDYDAGVTANSSTTFLAADGRGFKLSPAQWVTPFMFGCANDNTFTTDQTLLVQDFWTWYNGNPNTPIDTNLDAGITAPIIIGPSSEPSPAAVRTIVGTHRLRMKSGSSAAQYIVKVRNITRTTWHGAVHGEGPGGFSTFAQRDDFAVGVEFENCGRLRFTGVCRGDRVWFAGIAAARPNNNLLEFRHIWATDCGSGNDNTNGSGGESPGVRSLIGEWSDPEQGKIESGSYVADPTGTAANSTSQRTKVTLSAFPPVPGANVPDYCAPTESLYQLRFDGDPKLYKVTAWNVGSGYVEIYPWLDTTTLGTSGDYEWVFGGGWICRSGDGQIIVQGGTLTNCGRGFWIGAQYAAKAHNQVVTSCGYGACLGREQGGSTLMGAELSGFYCEGNRADLIFSDSPGDVTYGYVQSDVNLDRLKIYELGQPRDGSNNRPELYATKDGAWRVQAHGRYLNTRAVQTSSSTAPTVDYKNLGALMRLTSGSAVTFTVPPYSSVRATIGDFFDMVMSGTGTLTVAGGTGVTVNANNDFLGPFLRYTRMRVEKVAEPNTWSLSVWDNSLQAGRPGMDTSGNVNVTLTSSSRESQRFDTALTQNRTVTLPAPGVNGKTFLVTRGANATGAFNLTVQTSASVALKVLSTAGTWAMVRDDGTEYRLVAAGTL